MTQAAPETAIELSALIRDRMNAAGMDMTPPRIGLILGSGLGSLADTLADDPGSVTIPYDELPGFPHASVSGHSPKLVIGALEGVRVALFGGRAHYYEHGNPAEMRVPIEVLKALGCHHLILTNAAGSLRDDIAPGDVMLLSDHIAFAGTNPLIGEPTDARFVPMTDAHDPNMRAALIAAAKAEGIALTEGVYCWFSGPSFETPAEIRAARVLGADAVGMSTVPEVILARFVGLRVAAVSVITNMGAGLSTGEISHSQTKAVAPIGAAKFARILRRYLRML